MPFRMRWLTQNFGLKLVSLLLAVGFWFYVVGEESIEITKTIPLEISSSNEKVSIVQSSTQFLEVTFQCPRHLLSVLSSREVSAVHLIEAVESAGDYSFNVSVKDIVLPAPEIRVTKIFPSFVTVTLDEVIVKKTLVKANLIGEPALGYRVDEDSIELDPNAVLVEGPKAILESMETIETEPIQLVGRIRSFKRKVRINELPEVKVIGEGATEVHVPVTAEFSEKELADVPVRPLGAPAVHHFISLVTDQVTVTLKGPRAILETIERDDVLAYVEVGDLKSGSHEIPLQLILPSESALKGEVPIIGVIVSKFKS